MTIKKIIIMDHETQGKENNIDWKDYPVIIFNTETKKERKAKKSLGHYISSWEEYLKQANGYDWKI